DTSNLLHPRPDPRYHRTCETPIDSCATNGFSRLYLSFHYQKDLMKLLPPFGGISRAILDQKVYQSDHLSFRSMGCDLPIRLPDRRNKPNRSLSRVTGAVTQSPFFGICEL